jgi:hypothetical protein
MVPVYTPAAWVAVTKIPFTMVTMSVPPFVLAVAFQMLCAVGDALYPT